jgi:hypothetical protein
VEADEIAKRRRQRDDPHRLTAEAYDAIWATLPVGSVAVEAEANERGERYVWLEEVGVNRLRAIPGPGECYSDAIPRLVEAASTCVPAAGS